MSALRYCSAALAVCILVFLVFQAAPVSSAAREQQLKWHQIDTPGSVPAKNDVVSPSEVNCMAITSDNRTCYVTDIPWVDMSTGGKALYKSVDSGISWDDSIGKYLFNTMSPAEQANFRIWYIAAAPDNVDFIAVVTNRAGDNLPRNVWFSQDGGLTWVSLLCPVTSTISTIAVSSINGGSRDVAVGTRSGTGTGDVWTMNSLHLFNWAEQELNGDVVSLRFSPRYSSDDTLVTIFSNAGGTFLTVGIHDSPTNYTDWQAIYQQGPIEITTGSAGSSPKADQIISADLALPRDYAGQLAATRRYFVSIDCPLASAGVYRFDDAAGYHLMSATLTQRISGIAYYGSSTSGKLLAGEVLGSMCDASVMTWYTDDPFTCRVPCWYPAVKPPTGGAGADDCAGVSYGNARVAWSPDGSLAFVGTASTGVLAAGVNWADGYLTGRMLDESSFSISRNNGKTWSQISLIDTQISNLSDLAPAPDCSRLYVASINANVNCCGFDSVWRSDGNPPGSRWERVLCEKSGENACTGIQSDTVILRLAGDKSNGEAVVWSAQGTDVLKWSPDYGECWNSIQHSLAVQDIAFEDSKTLFILSRNGQVQRFEYQNSGWHIYNNIYSGVDSAYSIATAYSGVTPDNDKGFVLVGGSGDGIYDAAYSSDGGKSFRQVDQQLPVRDNTLVVASASFNSDGYIMAANSGGMFAYSIYTTGDKPWEEWWGGAAWPDPVTGLSISRNSSYYFSTAATWGTAIPYVRWSSALSGFDPSISLGAGNRPTTRFRLCGGLELDQPASIYIIDQRPFNPPAGGIWSYTDDLLWSGPRPKTPVSYFKVSTDPVTGRAGAIVFKWLPKSLSRGYCIYISKDVDFYLTVAKIGDDYFGPFYVPYDLDEPSMYVPPGGGVIIDANNNSWTVPPLEAGHTYYWKVKVQDVATGDAIKSPWSWRESYQVIPGFRIVSPYPGVQLNNPANGCKGCTVKPASFSWSPWKEATKYQFDLARDTEFKSMVVTATTTTTGYGYKGTLDYNTNYFWRVKALEVNGRNIPSDWSATFSLQTEPAPSPPATASAEPATPLWVWVVIAVGAILVVVVLVLLTRMPG
jgi:hypothetical protein